MNNFPYSVHEYHQPPTLVVQKVSFLYQPTSNLLKLDAASYLIPLFNTAGKSFGKLSLKALDFFFIIALNKCLLFASKKPDR